jgi:transposase
MAHAPPHTPAMRLVTAGHAVKALVLNGLGCVNQHLDLGPRLFQDTPSARLLAPGVLAAKPLHAEALGRALETLDDDGVTALYRRRAATAAARLGLTPHVAPLESPSFPVEGRSHSDHAPDAQVVHLMRGESREHRPDLKHVMRAWMVEQHAGMPVRMKPLRGHSRDAPAGGQVVQAHLAQLPTTDGTTSLGADRARSREDNRPPRSEPRLPWMPWVPATLRAAPAALAQAAPQPMAPP